MSHFSVAVISKNEDDIFELIAPYCVAGAGASSKYLEFVDETDDIKNKFFDEKNTMEIVVLKSGKILPKYSDYFLKEVVNETDAREKVKKDGKEYETKTVTNHKLNKTYTYFYDWGKRAIKDIPVSQYYKTFKEYGIKLGYTWDEQRKCFGYYTNPNGKYDYYEIGGRYQYFLKSENGKLSESTKFRPTNYREGYCDSAKIKDVDFRFDMEKYKQCERIWEVIVDGAKATQKEKDDFIHMWRSQVLLDRYETKENFAITKSTFNTYGVITPDGKWHSRGEMGMFGVSCNEEESEIDWVKNYYNRFIAKENKNYYITIIDFHI